MDFDLSEEQKMLQTMARDFLTAECPKKLVREMIEDEKGYPPELWRKMADLGWMQLVFPEQYGGTGGSFLDLAVLLEEMGRALLPGPFFSTVVLGGLTLLELGSEQQKQELLPKIGRGELVITLAVTEPNGRQDLDGIETKAVAEGESYVINGTKTFCSLSPVASFTFVMALTDKTKGKKGLSCILVESDRPGYIVGRKEKKMGQKGVPVGELVLQDVRIPRENLVGKEGEGFKIALASLDPARICAACLAVGIMQAALDASVKYAKQRVQFGQPIAEFQAIQWKIASMRTSLEASRLLTYQAASLMTSGRRYTLEAAMAKLFATDEATKVVSEAVQIHGGYGYMKDYPVERYFRDAKICQIYDGTNEIQRLVIARNVLDAAK